jgi:hypothetical protein
MPAPLGLPDGPECAAELIGMADPGHAGGDAQDGRDGRSAGAPGGAG